MDDIRKNKITPRPRFQSIDGFTPSTKAPLDNFKRAEGYTANPSAQLGTSLPRLPSVEAPVRTRRSIFGRRKASTPAGTRALRIRRRSGRKKILKGFLAVPLVIVLIGGFLFAKGYINFHKIFSGGGGAAALQQNVDPSKLKGEGDGRVNILVMGRGGDGHDGADLTDTIILMSIDPISKDAALVSLPRDLYVKVPDQGSMKINAAYATGKSTVLNRAGKQTDEVKKKAEEAGFKSIEDTIENTLGIPVHYHAMIDFTGFKKAVDTVGGVDLTATQAVSEQMRIDGRPYLLDVQPGKQHFDGFRALAYARSRHTSPRGDFDRSERQRLIIVALKAKILSAGTYSNPAKLSALFGEFGEHVQTNFSSQDLNRLYDLSKDIGQSKISSIGLVDPPHDFLTTSNIGGQSVVIPKAGVNNYKDIQSYLRNTLRDSFLKNENASIMVLNGTQAAGLATAKAEELKSFGYSITAVDNAPTKNYPKTILVDLRSGSKKYTQHYLEQRFKTTAVTSLPDPKIIPGPADFVIIIGDAETITR